MSILKSTLVLVLLSGCVLGVAHAAKPKLSLEAARKVALKEVPGARVQSEELEHEHGRLVYSFDLKVADKPGIEEVQVDANSGKVVSHEHESPDAERKEQAKEKTKPSAKAGAGLP